MSWASLPPDLQATAQRVLTRKQLDVLKLWLNGYGSTRISVQLGVAEPTARGHLRRALQKLEPHVDRYRKQEAA